MGSCWWILTGRNITTTTGKPAAILLLTGWNTKARRSSPPADTEEQVLKREDMARLLRAMEALTPAQRELVRRVYFENESIAAVARSEGVHESSIRERLRWIYKKLKKFLE